MRHPRNLPNQENQTKAKMIPAKLVGEHIDRLDALNKAWSELAALTASAELDVQPAELLTLLSDKYSEIRETLFRSVWPEGEGGAQ